MWAKPRAKTTARGYSAAHQRLRRALLPSAYGTPCVRCGEPMLKGQALHLDHNSQRDGYLGFAHAKCNIKAAAKKARAKQLYGSRPTTAHRW
jgi:hypothetical protein